MSKRLAKLIALISKSILFCKTQSLIVCKDKKQQKEYHQLALKNTPKEVVNNVVDDKEECYIELKNGSKIICTVLKDGNTRGNRSKLFLPYGMYDDFCNIDKEIMEEILGECIKNV